MLAWRSTLAAELSVLANRDYSRPKPELGEYSSRYPTPLRAKVGVVVQDHIASDAKLELVVFCAFLTVHHDVDGRRATNANTSDTFHATVTNRAHDPTSFSAVRTSRQRRFALDEAALGATASPALANVVLC